MADICIVYARADAGWVPPALERLLSPPWSVWWDRKIKIGDYRRAIVSELAKARCLIPIWSREAEFSSTLFDEVQKAQRRGVPILPIRIHDVDAPPRFGPLQMTSMFEWDGDSNRPELRDYLQTVGNVLA